MNNIKKLMKLTMLISLLSIRCGKLGELNLVDKVEEVVANPNTQPTPNVVDQVEEVAAIQNTQTTSNVKEKVINTKAFSKQAIERINKIMKEVADTTESSTCKTAGITGLKNFKKFKETQWEVKSQLTEMAINTAKAVNSAVDANPYKYTDDIATAMASAKTLIDTRKNMGVWIIIPKSEPSSNIDKHICLRLSSRLNHFKETLRKNPKGQSDVSIHKNNRAIVNGSEASKAGVAQIKDGKGIIVYFKK